MMLSINWRKQKMARYSGISRCGKPDEDKMTSREKFMRYRDKVTKNPLYLSNPSSLVSPDLLRHKNIYQFGNGTEFVEMNGQIFNPHPNVFIPLEVE